MKKYLILLLLLCSCSPGGKFSLHEENDILDYTNKNQDRFYTQGLKLSYITPIENGYSTSYSAGQSIYNPQHKHLDPPREDERPYAGYLYGEYTRHYYTERNVEDNLGVQLGVIGPWALGKETQDGFHKIIGNENPAGWDSQLNNEPAITLQLERKYRTDPYQFLGFAADAIANGRADLGNVSTLAGLGGMVRYGKLPNDFGGDIIHPTAIFDGDYLHSYYLFVGTEERAVARNIFLDGNTFEYSPRVTKEPFVNDIKFGLEADYAGFRVDYTVVYRSNEYKDTPSAANFGSLDLSYEW